MHRTASSGQATSRRRWRRQTWLMLVVLVISAATATAAAALTTDGGHHAHSRTSPGLQRASHQTSVTSPATRLAALLNTGYRAASKSNVDSGEILGIAAPGAGQILRIQSRYNLAKRIQASGIDAEAGLLRSDSPAVQTMSVQDLILGRTGYIRSTAAGARWVKETLQPTAAASANLPRELLTLARPRGVTEIATGRTGSSYRVVLHGTDLALLDALSAQFPSSLRKVSAANATLLSGAVLSMPDLVISLDRQDRVTQLKGEGTLTETRAVAAATGEPYPRRGIAAVVLVNVVSRYGGALTIVAPPSDQIINPDSPLQ